MSRRYSKSCLSPVFPKRKKKKTKESGETQVLGAATPLPAFRAVHPLGVSGRGRGYTACCVGLVHAAHSCLSLVPFTSFSTFPFLLPSSCYELPLLSLSACSLFKKQIGDEGCTKLCNALAEAENTSVTTLEYVWFRVIITSDNNLFYFFSTCRVLSFLFE